MFEKKYREEMDSIQADQSVLEQICEQYEHESKPRRKVPVFRIATACAAAFAIVLGSVFLPKLLNPKTTPSGDLNTATATNYEFIFEKLSNLKNAPVEGGGIDLYTDTLTGSFASSSIKENASSAGTSDTASPTHSQTTTQVAGVDEADIIKTDGKYIYSLTQNKLRITAAESGRLTAVQNILLENTENCRATEMFLAEGKIIVLFEDYNHQTREYYTKFTVIDVSDPVKPETVGSCRQSGFMNTSRLIGNTLYVISNYSVNVSNMELENTSTYVPSVATGNLESSVECDTVHICEEALNTPSYVVVCSYDVASAEMIATQSLLGGSDTVYCSTDNLIVTAPCTNGISSTFIARFSLNNGDVRFEKSSTISGSLLNQFSIDEYNEHFRFVVTEYRDQTTFNSLYILDNNLEKAGSIENLAEGERVYSVRFMKNIAYFVTFRQTDPLYSADLSDPKNPKILGALKIPGFSNYLFPYGENRLLGIGMDADQQTGRTNFLKLSLFDTSDPANVTEFDKKILDGFRYSEALYNHKDCLVDAEKNLFGFSAFGENDRPYFLYTHDDKGFQQAAVLPNPVDAKFVRGLFIENYFYIVTDRDIRSYDLYGGMKMISSLKY